MARLTTWQEGLRPQLMDAYHVLKSIVREIIDTGRLHARLIEETSELAVSVDGNDEQLFCRVRLTHEGGWLCIVAQSHQTYPVSRVNDLYTHADGLRRAASAWQRVPRAESQNRPTAE